MGGVAAARETANKPASVVALKPWRRLLVCRAETRLGAVKNRGREESRPSRQECLRHHTSSGVLIDFLLDSTPRARLAARAGAPPPAQTSRRPRTRISPRSYPRTDRLW